MKTGSICEVCHRAVNGIGNVKHGRQPPFVVGRKLNGVVRVVCGENRCRQEWKRIGSAIRGTWPENSSKFDTVVRDLTTGQERVAPIQTEVDTRADIFAPLHQEDPMQKPTQTTEPRLIESDVRHRIIYPIALSEWAVEWVRRHGARKGTFVSMARYVLKEHPEWATDGQAVASEKALAEQIRKACIHAAVWTVQSNAVPSTPAMPTATELGLALVGAAAHAKPVEEALAPQVSGDRMRRYAQLLIGQATTKLAILVERDNIAALETIVEMIEEEVGR